MSFLASPACCKGEGNIDNVIDDDSLIGGPRSEVSRVHQPFPALALPTHGDVDDTGLPETEIVHVNGADKPIEESPATTQLHFLRSPTGIKEVEDHRTIVDKVSERKDKTAFEAKKVREEAQKKITQTTKFQMVIGLWIVANAAAMGFEADAAPGTENVFYVLEHIFTVVFVIEMLMRFHFEGVKNYFKDHASILDFFLVMMSVVDVWVISALGSAVNLRAMSLLRLLRLCRLARLLRLFRLFKELTVIVAGFMSSTRTLFWASVFLVIIVYMFAIFATLRFGREVADEEGCENQSGDARLLSAFRMLKGGGGGGSGGPYGEAVVEEGSCAPLYRFNEEEVGTQEILFGTVYGSMLTLFVCLSEGCGMDIVRPMTNRTPWVILYWYVFTFITSFGILNVIIGLFCENVMQAALEAEKGLQKEVEEIRTQRLASLKELFDKIDTDHSQTISRDEFMLAVSEDEEVMDAMFELGLHEEVGIFDTLDVNKAGVLSHADFYEGMMMLLKGNDVAKAKDLVSTYLTTQAIFGEVKNLRHGLKTQLGRTFEKLGDEIQEVRRLCKQLVPVPTDTGTLTVATGSTRASSNSDSAIVQEIRSLKLQMCQLEERMNDRINSLEQRTVDEHHKLREGLTRDVTAAVRQLLESNASNNNVSVNIMRGGT